MVEMFDNAVQIAAVIFSGMSVCVLAVMLYQYSRDSRTEREARDQIATTLLLLQKDLTEKRSIALQILHEVSVVQDEALRVGLEKNYEKFMTQLDEEEKALTRMEEELDRLDKRRDRRAVLPRERPS